MSIKLVEYEQYRLRNQNLEKDTGTHIIKLPDFSTMPKAGEYVKVHLPWCNRDMIARVSTTGLNWIWENQNNDDFWCNEYIKDGDIWEYIH